MDGTCSHSLGILFALTPFGKIKGTEEISNVMLYIVIALIASRADLSAVGNAPIWLLAGFVILVIHVVIMIILAKVLKWIYSHAALHHLPT